MNTNQFLKAFFDALPQVPCHFFGEGEREDMGGVDVFFFDYVCDPGGDGRGLACVCACED